MEIGYSEEILWLAICKQMAEVQSKSAWLKHYTGKREIDNIENCVQYIMESCNAILENIEYLRGEPM